MLINEPSFDMLSHWKTLGKEYQNKIKPNRKSGGEVLDYVKNKYPLIEIKSIHGENIDKMIADEIKSNEYSSWRLPVGKKPEIKAFILENKGSSKLLYDEQDNIFKGLDIFIAVDLVTGYTHIEGSSRLYDEIKAYQGLDEIDIQNNFLVAEYVECCQNMNKEL